MTLRLRLTLWYTLLLAVILLIFAMLFHAILARTLFSQVDDTVRSQADQVVAILQADIDPTRSRLPVAIVLASQVLAQAMKADGEVYDRSPSLMGETLILPEHIRQTNLKGVASFYTWRDAERYLRVYSVPVHAPDGRIVAIVQIAQSLAPIESVLKIVRLALLVGGAAAFGDPGHAGGNPGRLLVRIGQGGPAANVVHGARPQGAGGVVQVPAQGAHVRPVLGYLVVFPQGA